MGWLSNLFGGSRRNDAPPRQATSKPSAKDAQILINGFAAGITLLRTKSDPGLERTIVGFKDAAIQSGALTAEQFRTKFEAAIRAGGNLVQEKELRRRLSQAQEVASSVGVEAAKYLGPARASEPITFTKEELAYVQSEMERFVTDLRSALLAGNSRHEKDIREVILQFSRSKNPCLREHIARVLVRVALQFDPDIPRDTEIKEQGFHLARAALDLIAEIGALDEASAQAIHARFLCNRTGAQADARGWLGLLRQAKLTLETCGYQTRE
jgi:hypothetical protein